MPELPEVETIVRGLVDRIVGHRIQLVYLGRGDIVHGHPMPLCAAMHRRRIKNIHRRGKQIHIQLDSGFVLMIHLGMSGRLVLVDRDKSVEPHTHLRVTFSGRRFELRYCDPRRFGGLWLLDPREKANDSWFGRRMPRVGKDALDLSLAELRGILHRHRRLKALLLDQGPVSGLGNIYCDESLHRAGLHPLTIASELDDQACRRLWQAIRRVLHEAVRAGGSTISDYRTANNQSGMFQFKHRVYQRGGKPCRTCRTTIEHLTVAGRSTFVCPRCQPKLRT